MRNRENFENDPLILEAIDRNLISIKKDKITYNINQKKEYVWTDPEEWVRAWTISFLVLKKSYTPKAIRTEVVVPRRTPNDFADIVVYNDENCREIYLVVENKREGITKAERDQAIEQAFGNANSLRSPLALYDNGEESILYDVANYPQDERKENKKGSRDSIPVSYGNLPKFTYVAGDSENDIKPVDARQLELKVKQSHSIIWAGGKRDPLSAFDEWSKLMLAKVQDERHTPNGKPRQFQVGTNETYVSVASRIHHLFKDACLADPSFFPETVKIDLPDKKIEQVVSVLQNISITDSSVDNIGKAFEIFFGSVFRGELGQYFTMRQLARFTVSMLDINNSQYVIDPTCGSGGFLLEVLLQVWNKLDKEYAGRRELERLKNDFALNNVYGIEIHDILARICKINLLLHHDGHTNIEGDKSCLDILFTKERLNIAENNFNVVIGNPPFGDTIIEGDEDQLGNNSLKNFTISEGSTQIPSEHIIVEKSIKWLKEDGLLGMVLPDGVLNNQGSAPCKRLRNYLAKNGRVIAVVSLPDFAFRKSGAQNKTSILFYRKFSYAERTSFYNSYDANIEIGFSEEEAIKYAISRNNYKVFMAEAHNIGYSPSGVLYGINDLYRGDGAALDENQKATILGEYRKFKKAPDDYIPYLRDCMALDFYSIWTLHKSHRLDPKYYLFREQESQTLPEGWVKKPVCELMTRRAEQYKPQDNPLEKVTVMTLSQTGDIRRREAGKGINPPEWIGMYFQDSTSDWYKAHKGDIVYSSIDLWKGCISVVGEEFDGAIVTKEYPIYQLTTEEIIPEFLGILFRSRYYRRAFRAITTGHSNRRRTQQEDFEAIEVIYPADKKEQQKLIKDVLKYKKEQLACLRKIDNAMMAFSNIIDGRGEEDYDMNDEETDNEE